MSGLATRFEKWEGLGNDFVVLEVIEGVALDAEIVRRLCDRRRGIGADGVLVVDAARPRMDVWNADGSRPEMCGNGLRCVAAYLVARGLPASLTVATGAGDRRCEVSSDGDHAEVLVDMGRARLGEPLVVAAFGGEHRFQTVDVGNPHAVTFEAYGDDVFERLGPLVAAAPPGGVNVELCRISRAGDRAVTRIDVLVWERGVGPTLACGTGACAVAAAACALGRAPFGEPIHVELPGGGLAVTVAAGTLALSMRGPARRVFSGEVVIA